jgi:anti-sigma B factor antagonist
VPSPLIPPPPTDLLAVTALPGDGSGRVVVEVTGAVDTSTAPLLDACLRTQSGRRGVRELVVDLEQVTVLAAAGVAVLAQAHRRCRLRGARFAVRSGGRRNVLLALELSGAADSAAVDPPDTVWQQTSTRRPAPQAQARTRQRPSRRSGSVCR